MKTFPLFDAFFLSGFLYIVLVLVPLLYFLASVTLTSLIFLPATVQDKSAFSLLSLVIEFLLILRVTTGFNSSRLSSPRDVTSFKFNLTTSVLTLFALLFFFKPSLAS